MVVVVFVHLGGTATTNAVFARGLQTLSSTSEIGT